MYIEWVLTKTTPQALAATQLGAFPFTYSAACEAFTSGCYTISIGGIDWTAQLQLDGKKVVIYAWDDDGNNVHSDTPYAPAVTLLAALTNMLRNH